MMEREKAFLPRARKDDGFGSGGFPRASACAGNAMVYVLIVIVLFAALGLVMARGGDSSESGALSEERIEIYAGQILETSMQLKQAVDQMVYGGESAATLDFTLPGGAGFGTAPFGSKVFHPQGGGVVLPRLPSDAVAQENTDPPPGWYIGSFNNVDWTIGAGNDVIAVAHQIPESVCARINEKLTGSESIPELSQAVRRLLIDSATSSLGAGNNQPFTAADCAACDGKPSLCVKDNGVAAWTFYSILVSE